MLIRTVRDRITRPRRPSRSESAAAWERAKPFVLRTDLDASGESTALPVSDRSAPSLPVSLVPRQRSAAGRCATCRTSVG